MVDRYIREHGRRLYGLCCHLCGNVPDADDLYQETWLKVVKNIARYDPEREFEPWLTRICVNTYRNSLRRAMRSPIFGFSDGEKQERALMCAPAPQGEDYSELYEAVECLPEKLRLAVILYYFRDMDIAAAAAALGVPAGTVKSRLNRARRLLREVLDETDLRF